VPKAEGFTEHDGLNGRVFNWDPAWSENYGEYAHWHDQARNIINWDGLLLDGWEPL
jgi:hypothetical protein